MDFKGQRLPGGEDRAYRLQARLVKQGLGLVVDASYIIYQGIQYLGCTTILFYHNIGYNKVGFLSLFAEILQSNTTQNCSEKEHDLYEEGQKKGRFLSRNKVDLWPIIKGSLFLVVAVVVVVLQWQKAAALHWSVLLTSVIDQDLWYSSNVKQQRLFLHLGSNQKTDLEKPNHIVQRQVIKSCKKIACFYYNFATFRYSNAKVQQNFFRPVHIMRRLQKKFRSMLCVRIFRDFKCFGTMMTNDASTSFFVILSQ